MNAQEISAVLFKLDPMGTACVENDLFDEYDDVATLIANGTPIKKAFDQRFWEDCLTAQQLSSIEIELSD